MRYRSFAFDEENAALGYPRQSQSKAFAGHPQKCPLDKVRKVEMIGDGANFEMLIARKLARISFSASLKSTTVVLSSYKEVLLKFKGSRSFNISPKDGRRHFEMKLLKREVQTLKFHILSYFF